MARTENIIAEVRSARIDENGEFDWTYALVGMGWDTIG